MSIRISCEIPENLNEFLNENVPWGCKSDIFRALFNCYVVAVKEHGKGVMMDLLDGEMQLTHFNEKEQPSIK